MCLSNKLLELVSTFKIGCKKLILFACITSPLRRRPVKCHCCCRVCNHPCASVSASICIIRAVHDFCMVGHHWHIIRRMYYSEVLSEGGAECVHNMYVCHKYSGQQVMLSAMVRMRFQRVTPHVSDVQPTDCMWPSKVVSVALTVGK